jgi:hypothetical protein
MKYPPLVLTVRLLASNFTLARLKRKRCRPLLSEKSIISPDISVPWRFFNPGMAAAVFGSLEPLFRRKRESAQGDEKRAAKRGGSE